MCTNPAGEPYSKDFLSFIPLRRYIQNQRTFKKLQKLHIAVHDCKLPQLPLNQRATAARDLRLLWVYRACGAAVVAFLAKVPKLKSLEFGVMLGIRGDAFQEGLRDALLGRPPRCMKQPQVKAELQYAAGLTVINANDI